MFSFSPCALWAVRVYWSVLSPTASLKKDTDFAWRLGTAALAAGNCDTYILETTVNIKKIIAGNFLRPLGIFYDRLISEAFFLLQSAKPMPAKIMDAAKTLVT
jgi:hypothetical protein